MKEKYFSSKFIILTIVLFTCIFIFSIPSLALIPGDFGSADNGPPDGVVDFEDLMIFALAYGSIPADTNWNSDCDIYPDRIIDFEDLMIFALHYGEEAQAIIPDTTEIIDQETEEAILSVSEDQSTMVLSYSTPQADSIEVGDIIIMGVTDQTPYGLLRKVTGIDKGTTKYSPVYFYLGFATLEEAIQKGQWEYSQTLKPEDIEKGFVFPEGIRPVTGKASTTLDFEYPIDVILHDQDDNPATTEDNITATGYIAFNYQVTFDGEIDGHTLKHFIFENIIETDSELNISVGLSVSIADLADVADVTIGEPIPFTPVTIYIPTPIPPIVIPLVFFPSIELKVGIEGEAHIVLDVGITQTTSYTAGIEFTDGDWQNITDPLPNIVNTIKLADPEGTIHVTAHAGPQLNCKLYKAAGPYCNIFGYLYFDADTTLDPWWDLDAGLTVSAGVKMDVLSFHWDSGELPLFDLLPRFDVDDAGGPFGGTGPVHNLTKDTYYNTIQAALDDADDGNTIEVSDGTYDESIHFPSGKVIILRSVNGPSSTIIRGNNDSKTVYLSSSLEGTTLNGFTITHHDGLIGGGIYMYNSANLIINNCIISNNNSNVSQGGGIYNYGNTLTITGSTISDNTGYDGGGIYNDHGTLTITESTVFGNSAAYYGGGGIYNWSGTITITSSTVSNNAAEYDGGGIYNLSGTITITESTISNNSTNVSQGGGIYNYDNTLTITGSTISDNSAAGYGGGICNWSGTITITESTISSNSAFYNGGGIYIVSTSGNIIIGGINNTDTDNFNTFINNYKTGDAPSADQHIWDYDTGDCHMDYPYNYFTPDNNGTYALRDIGPAGGYIFYDKGYYSNGWRYLEAAPASTEWDNKQWGSFYTLIGGTETGIGTGQSNTTTIVAWLDANEDNSEGDVTYKTDRAAYLCDALVYGGYSDWFLPSKDELNLMYENLQLFGVGGFMFEPGWFVEYWSSSENSSNYAWSQTFSVDDHPTGSQYATVKYGGLNVRAARAF